MSNVLSFKCWKIDSASTVVDGACKCEGTTVLLDVFGFQFREDAVEEYVKDLCSCDPDYYESFMRGDYDVIVEFDGKRTRHSVTGEWTVNWIVGVAKALEEENDG